MASPPIIPNVTAVQPHAIPFHYDHDEKSGILHYNPNLAPKEVSVDMPDSDRYDLQTDENPPNSSSPGGGAKKTRRSSKKRASHKRLRKDKRKGTRKAKRGAKRTRRR